MLKGKTALVTGGARGIGAAICKKLASMGADIAIVDLTVTEQAQALEAELAAQYGVKAKAYACNVSDAEQCKAAVKQVLADFGSLTVLVNNAGITRDALILGMKETDFDAVISTNLKGTFNMTQACYRPFMKQKYGKIVNLASVSAQLSMRFSRIFSFLPGSLLSVLPALRNMPMTCHSSSEGQI